jgi:putative ABC transport system ATP-binding protein
VRCRDVARTYWTESGRVDALRGVNVDAAAGSVTAVTGPSGSGKSSLLRIVAGLDEPNHGTVEVAGVRLDAATRRSRRRFRRSQVGLVHQRASDNLISYLTVEEHLYLAARLRGRGREGIENLVRAVGLERRLSNRPSQMSGGEQQRLALAQAVVGNPVVVLADEPTAELDRSSADDLIELLSSLGARGIAVLVATHDPYVAAAADRVFRLDHGVVA